MYLVCQLSLTLLPFILHPRPEIPLHAQGSSPELKPSAKEEQNVDKIGPEVEAFT
jgi:hypothetical protein